MAGKRRAPTGRTTAGGDHRRNRFLSSTAYDSPTERSFSDFRFSGLTIGKHAVAFYRQRLQAMGVLDNEMAKAQRDGAVIQIAGCIITRQRPGTAKGFVFLSLEDETGIVNVIVHPGLFARRRSLCVSEPYLLIKGVLQNTWNVVSVKAGELKSLSLGGQMIPSHDFH